MRYVRKTRRIYDFSLCKLCGTAGGTCGTCGRTTCLLCGSPQCSSNGLRDGQCPICYHGLLPGWSGSDCKCTYKGCNKTAVARGRGRRPICMDHAIHQFGPDYVAKRLSERDTAWDLIAD